MSDDLFSEVRGMYDVPCATVNLTELFAKQHALQDKMGWPGGRNKHGAKQMLLAMIVEGIESLDEFDWKPWKPDGYKEVDRVKLGTEITDILQFWANYALCLGFSPEELTSYLRNKWKVNDNRIENGETTTGEG